MTLINTIPHYQVVVKLPQGADIGNFVDRVWEKVHYDSIDDMEWGNNSLRITPSIDVCLNEAQRLEKLVYEVAAEFGYELEGV